MSTSITFAQIPHASVHLSRRSCCHRHRLSIARNATSYRNTVSHRREFASLRVNQARLNKAIHDGCRHGEAHRYGSDATETGMARLSLSDADKSIRDEFRTVAGVLGCRYFVDQMGNQFAVRSGRQPHTGGIVTAPVMMGSHLDTQPTGGRYDGILGVNAGLEVLKVLHENDYVTNFDVGVVNWTNEEGARFPKMAVSSGVWAEALPISDAWNLEEVSPDSQGQRRTMKQELERIGYFGPEPASHRSNPFAAHFELHIEQGPILEIERQKVGVVIGAQAFKWFEITVKGRDSHAGTTPFNARMDAMLCAAKLIVKSNEIAKEHNGLATTGIVRGVPQAVNTMAHTVTLTLDIRHASDKTLAIIEETCRQSFESIASKDSEKGCEIWWKSLVDSPAVQFNQDCIAAVESSAIEVCKELPKTSQDGQLWKYMISGAGHDSCYTNQRCPTTMIFVPTKDGISHNPREYCSAEDCTIGTQVLLGAVLRFDKLRAERNRS